jgi:hypothetical protein
MVTMLKVHFDGLVFVPETPVDLLVGTVLEIPIQRQVVSPATDRPLIALMEALDQVPANPNWPADGAAQHDHYLCGTPKKP